MLFQDKLFTSVARTDSSLRMTARKAISQVAGAFETIGRGAMTRLLREKADQLFCSSVSDGHLRNVYNEETLRTVLADECKRSERSGREFQILLVSLAAPDESSVSMGKDTASQLLVALGRCLRGTDYIGWYRERLVLGAVLTAIEDNPQAMVSYQIEQRIIEVFRECLSVDDFDRIQFSVCRYRELEGAGSGSAARTI
jgi:hypothetical protein